MRLEAAPSDQKPSIESLVGLNETAQFLKIDEESLAEWTAAGYAPHYLYNGKGPYFHRAEIKKWARTYILERRGGLPIPKMISVLSHIGSSELTPPAAIAAIQNLQQVDMRGLVSGIYFLCFGDAVVYVGQTNVIMQRVASHVSEGSKEFDINRIFFLPCPPSQLLDMETKFISMLKPKYNYNKQGRLVLSKNEVMVRLQSGRCEGKDAEEEK